MAAHYIALRDQLVIDIRSAIGDSAPVIFGRPRRPIDTYPHATVNTAVRRQFGSQYSGLRSLGEEYSFEIEVRLALPTPYPEYGGEEAAMLSAAELINVLAPYDKLTPPDPSPAYGGVGGPRYVTEVEYVPTMDEDNYLAYRLKFETVCKVFQ